MDITRRQVQASAKRIAGYAGEISGTLTRAQVASGALVEASRLYATGQVDHDAVKGAYDILESEIAAAELALGAIADHLRVSRDLTEHARKVEAERAVTREQGVTVMPGIVGQA